MPADWLSGLERVIEYGIRVKTYMLSRGYRRNVRFDGASPSSGQPKGSEPRQNKKRGEWGQEGA